MICLPTHLFRAIFFALAANVGVAIPLSVASERILLACLTTPGESQTPWIIEIDPATELLTVLTVGGAPYNISYPIKVFDELSIVAQGFPSRESVEERFTIDRVPGRAEKLILDEHRLSVKFVCDEAGPPKF